MHLEKSLPSLLGKRSATRLDQRAGEHKSKRAGEQIGTRAGTMEFTASDFETANEAYLNR